MISKILFRHFQTLQQSTASYHLHQGTVINWMNRFARYSVFVPLGAKSTDAASPSAA
jgi:hypothetical protein